MKKNIVLLVVIALLIGGIGGYVLFNTNEHKMGGMMHESMMMGTRGGMDHSMMMVSSERDFVIGMIPHHQEAVDTAKQVLARGSSTEDIRTLATEIIAAQETEIAMLKGWHLAWYGEAYTENESYKPMMRDLSLLSGADLDRQFLEDMIPHHMGAIMMAQSVRPHIVHQEITTLADNIINSQTTEIELMQNLLKKL